MDKNWLKALVALVVILASLSFVYLILNNNLDAAKPVAVVTPSPVVASEDCQRNLATVTEQIKNAIPCSCSNVQVKVYCGELGFGEDFARVPAYAYACIAEVVGSCSGLKSALDRSGSKYPWKGNTFLIGGTNWQKNIYNGGIKQSFIDNLKKSKKTSVCGPITIKSSDQARCQTPTPNIGRPTLDPETQDTITPTPSPSPVSGLQTPS